MGYQLTIVAGVTGEIAKIGSTSVPEIFWKQVWIGDRLVFSLRFPNRSYPENSLWMNFSTTDSEETS
jgi:hypothetical protein